jgi:hypothetical protein
MIKQVDKYRKHCLWIGADLNAKSPPKAAWEMLCIPKKEGGLGVINLRAQNKALLLKNLHKFFNRLDVPWVHLLWEKLYSSGNLLGQIRIGSFRWTDILKLLGQFKGLAAVNIKDGRTCLLWHDLWGGIVPAQSFLKLFSFAKDTAITVFKARNATDLTQLFISRLSDQAIEQLHILLPLLDNLLAQDEDDIWTYIRGTLTFPQLDAIRV